MTGVSKKVWHAWVSAIVLLVASGVGYRSFSSRLEADIEQVCLPVSLRSFPLQLYGWSGQEIAISANVKRIAGNDDSLSAFYQNEQTKQWASIYIAYTARPRTMRGHRPNECYPANGWVHDETSGSEFTTVSGRRVSCQIHRFHKPFPDEQQVVLVNFYILNGTPIVSEKGFSGMSFRTPNLAGDIARYVTQVQISSALESSALALAEDLTDLILAYFPDPQGRVAIAEELGAALPRKP